MRRVPSPSVIPRGRPSGAAMARGHENIPHSTVDGSWKSAILRELACGVASALIFAPWAVGDTPQPQTPSIFKPESTPAESVFQLSLFVLAICAVIFIIGVFKGAIESSGRGRKTITRTVIGAGAGALLGGIFGGGKGAGIGSVIGGAGGLKEPRPSIDGKKSPLAVARKC